MASDLKSSLDIIYLCYICPKDVLALITMATHKLTEGTHEDKARFDRITSVLKHYYKSHVHDKNILN